MSDSEIGIKITAEASGVAPAASEATAQVVKLDSAVQDMAAQMKQAGQVTEQASQVVAVAMQSQVSAIDTATQAHRRMGIAGMEMMHVVRASSDAIAAGIPPFQVLTMEIGRIAEAAAYSGGALGKVGAIFQGPFGIAAIAATVIVGKVIEKLVEQKTELEENAKALEKVKIGDAGLSDLQGQLAKMFDTATGKIKDQNEQLRTNIEMQAIKTRTEAREKQEGANKQLNGIAPSWWSSPRAAAPQVRPLKEMLAQIDAGKLSVEEALRRSENMNFSGTNISRGDFQKAIYDRQEAAASIKNADDAENSLKTGQLAGQFKTKPKEKKERDSTVQDLDAGLEAMKTAWAKQQDAQGTFQEFSLQQEEQYWSKQKERTDLSGAAKEQIEKKWLAARQELKREEIEKALEGYKDELAAAGANMAEKLAILDREHAYIVKMRGADSKEAKAAETEITKAKQEAAQQRIAIAEQISQAEQDLELHKIEMVRANVEFQLQMGKLTQQQMIEQEKKFEDQRYAINASALQEKLKLMQQDPTTNPAKITQMQTQILQLWTQHQLALSKLTMQSALQRTAIERNAIQGVSQAFSASIAKMVTLQQSFAQGMRGIWQGLMNVIGNAIQQMIEQWLTKQLMALIMGRTQQGVTGVAQVSSNAAVAASAAYASTAAIPVVGPALAPGAAIAASQAVMAFAPMASARGGWGEVPFDGAVTELHKSEMVLPASLAERIRAMTTLPRFELPDAASRMLRPDPAATSAAPWGSRSDADGGDTHVHLHLSAIDGKSAKAFLVNNHDGVADAIDKAWRAGRRSRYTV